MIADTFRAGPMTGSPIEIQAVLHHQAAARHPDADLFAAYDGYIAALQAHRLAPSGGRADEDALLTEIYRHEDAFEAAQPQTMAGLALKLRYLVAHLLDSSETFMPILERRPEADAIICARDCGHFTEIIAWDLVKAVDALARSGAQSD